jgi:hypothetical protein
MGHFRGYFEGAKTCLTLKLSRAQGGTLEDAKARDFGPWFWDNDTRVVFFTYFALTILVYIAFSLCETGIRYNHYVLFMGVHSSLYFKCLPFIN